jgi:DNA replication ATP-dependent helicase Dna2
MSYQQISDIQEAIAKESKRSARPLQFRIRNIAENKIFLYLELESVDEDDQLSPQLEDCAIGWDTANGAGRGEVVSVLPEISTVNVEWTKGPVPRPGTVVQIWPPKFLPKLSELWADPKAAGEAIAWRDNLATAGYDPEFSLDSSLFQTLRPMQRSAFRLTGWANSFLWGPPGTGKTATLGRLLAQYIAKYPTHRILLLSTTNAAVDEALLAVDKGIRELGKKFPSPPCLRFGNRFSPDRYQADAQRLIPVRDRQLVEELRQLLETAPHPGEVELYHQWKERRDGVRDRIERQTLEQLAQARVAGMTSTYAVLRYDELRKLGPASLVVMDEASQIGKAYAMMLARLGLRRLFAGDPHQLSPIVRVSNCELVRNWLGTSPFSWMGATTAERTITLEEQFRMAAPINQAIQKAFYPQINLRVADTVRTDPGWQAGRKPLATNVVGNGHVCLVYVDQPARVARGFRGYECPESVDVVISIAAHLAKELQNPADRILILTPFRAQRAALDQRRIERSLPQTEVRTVHSVQGSEARFVIFDPVCPSSKFVNNAEGRKLVNVALKEAIFRQIQD